MSLLGFQRALADLVASPELWLRADAPPFIGRHDLTPRERSRLEAMVRDPLMAANCVLYRANRVTPLYTFLPMTCALLGTALRAELDAFWRSCPCADMQFLHEAARFARFLKERTAAGAIRNEFLDEIVAYEMAAMELRFPAPDGGDRVRLLRFSREPASLFPALSGANRKHGDAVEEETLAGLPRGEYWMLLDARSGELEEKCFPAQGPV